MTAESTYGLAFAVLTAVVGWIIRLTTYLTATREEVKAVGADVALIKGILFTNALNQGLQSGTVKRNSPITVPEETRKILAPMARELHEFYLETGVDKSDEELFFELVKKVPAIKELMEEKPGIAIAAVEIAKEAKKE